MSYRATQSITPLPPVISSVSGYALGFDHRTFGSAAMASGAWPTIRRVIYIPLFLPLPYRVLRLFTVNGAAVSGNIDIGVYSSVAGLPASKLVSSGSVAQAGINAIQTATVDFVLQPGKYHLALMVDNTTATLFRGTASLSTNALKMVGMTQETPGAMPLPATATPVVVASSYLPIFGIASVTLV